MKVVEFHRYGAADELQPAERPAPTAEAGQVLVTVSAVIVNPIDLAIRSGALAGMLGDVAFPVVLGWDFAGRLAGGERVAGMIPWFATRSGSYAEVVAVDPAWLAPVPDGVDDVTAAAVPVNALTARTALDLAGLDAGQTVLITGASGAVGGFAAQLAVAAGAHVLAVASTGDERYVAGLGVKEVLPRSDSADDLARAARTFAPNGVDVVVDAAGLGGALIGATRDGGVFVTPVPTAAPSPQRDVRIAVVQVEPDGAALADLLAATAAGRLVPRIDRTLPLAQAAEAHRRTADRSVRGKTVLVTG